LQAVAKRGLQQYSLGFETIHDFSRFFKRLTTPNPSHYRKINFEFESAQSDE